MARSVRPVTDKEVKKKRGDADTTVTLSNGEGGGDECGGAISLKSSCVQFARVTLVPVAYHFHSPQPPHSPLLTFHIALVISPPPDTLSFKVAPISFV